MKKRKKNFLIIGCILLIGFFIRWGVLVNICGPPVKSYPTMDEMNFRELAENILNYREFAAWTEGFYTVSTRAPVYPLIIASGYSIAGKHSYSIPKIINLVFDLMNILLLFLIGRRLFNDRFGFVISGIYAIFGHAPYFMAISSPHTLAVSLLLLTVLALTCIKYSYKLAVPALALSYALLIHTRPVFLVVLPFLFIAIWLQLSTRRREENIKKEKSGISKYWIWQNWKNKCLRSAIPVFLVLLFCLPWGIRNYRKHKIIVPVSTVSGWHIASNVNYDIKLSIKYLTDQLYTPGRRGFTEAAYFKAAREKLFEAFMGNPVKFIFYGVSRVVYCWSPRNAIFRLLSPKAYFFPIYIFDGILLPLPDFEGFIYLFLLSSVIAVIMLRKRIFKLFIDVFYRMRGIFVIIIGYALVHAIGIPLIAYRFLIEPLILIFFLALFFNYLSVIKQKYGAESTKKRKLELKFFAKLAIPLKFIEVIDSDSAKVDREEFVKTPIIAIYTALIFIFLLMGMPFISESNPQKNSYFTLLKSPQVLTYSELRDMQWKNLGNIAPKTKVIVQGIVRYLHPGFRFIENDYYAARDSNSTASRLYVRYGDDKNFLGIGDVRLNFGKINVPENGAMIKVTGEAKTGPFKEIIIDVDRWSD